MKTVVEVPQEEYNKLIHDQKRLREVTDFLDSLYEKEEDDTDLTDIGLEVITILGYQY